MAKSMGTVISHHPTKERKSAIVSELSNRLISHPSKVMLKVIMNRLKPQAEAIIAEEQARFRAGRSTGEHIFNLRVICEKFIQPTTPIHYHVFRDFKKAFDHVWHAALWTTMNKYNISYNIVCSIKSLYSNATNAVFPQWIY